MSGEPHWVRCVECGERFLFQEATHHKCGARDQNQPKRADDKPTIPPQPSAQPKPVFHFKPAAPINLEIVRILQAQIPAELGRLGQQIERFQERVQKHNAAICGTLLDGPVTEEAFKPEHEAMKKGLTDGLRGFLHRGVFPAGIEECLRHPEKIKFLEQAAAFLETLGRLEQTKGSSRTYPLLESTATSQREVWRRGYAQGIRAIRALLEGKLPTDVTNNGHEMKWFPPQTLA